MIASCEQVDSVIAALRIDYVRIAEHLDGRLSVFVREVRDDPPHRQFEIQFRSLGALRVTRENVDLGVPACSGTASICRLVNSPWIAEVSLEPGSHYGGKRGYAHFAIFTASFNVDVAAESEPAIREVAALTPEEFTILTSEAGNGGR